MDTTGLDPLLESQNMNMGVGLSGAAAMPGNKSLGSHYYALVMRQQECKKAC